MLRRVRRADVLVLDEHTMTVTRQEGRATTWRLETNQGLGSRSLVPKQDFFFTWMNTVADLDHSKSEPSAAVIFQRGLQNPRGPLQTPGAPDADVTNLRTCLFEDLVLGLHVDCRTRRLAVLQHLRRGSPVSTPYSYPTKGIVFYLVAVTWFLD